LATFFRVDAWICALGVNQSQHWAMETFRHLKESQCFTVAFRARHAKVAAYFFGNRPTPLMSDHDNWSAAKACESAYNRRVVGKIAIPMQLNKL
jgi:hypothetical protein